MAEPKKVKTRIINKHATAAVWDSKPNFIPLQAELIIYDKDDQYAYERYKIGDGSTPVAQLPFLVNPHTHEFKGTEGTVTANYTPAGSVSVTSTPKGTISKTVIEATPTTKEVLVATSEGTDATYTKGSCTFPTLKAQANEEVLTLDVNGGQYTPGTYTPGIKPTFTKISYVESIVITKDAPIFTGEQSTDDGSFVGTAATISSKYIPEGIIEENKN